MRLNKKLLAVLGMMVISTAYGQEEIIADSDSAFVNLDGLVIVGSRGKPRSNTDSPVPVDVFNLKETSKVIPQNNINQILNSIAPSFTSTPQTGADGTDHIDPAQLRGLGPDQSLVLVNGKRRHTSAHINTNGSPGRGTVGTDLNAIPSFALSNIEILRDGASAQYGSDAIAGVMNLRLKEDTGFSGQVSLGGNLSSESNDLTGGLDGEDIKLDLNYGTKFKNRKGFINFTLSAENRKSTHRANENTSSIFNAYNAIEERGRRDGVTLASYWENINTTNRADELVGMIQKYANQVDYFSPDYRNQINGANTINELQALLSTDVTNQELAYRGLTRKDFNMSVGQSEFKNIQLFYNTSIPLNKDWNIYSFGGYSYRDGEAGGFYRKPNQFRTFTTFYPNGYLPKIGSNISDISTVVGVKTKWNDWDIDLSQTFGKNIFDYKIRNTHNASMRFNSPTTFDAGGYSFTQNTTNLDVTKEFDVFNSLTFSFGGEFRNENYKIKAGEEGSYAGYDINGNILAPDAPSNLFTTDFFGSALPQGSQVFSGFNPQSAVSADRNSFGVYAEASSEINDWWLMNLALRYEDYSDFGNTFNYKLSSRVKLNNHINLRVAGSTGFRAPSIHQIYYTNVSTQFLNGELLEIGTFNNRSTVANLLGIPNLKEEKSKSISSGFVLDWPELNLVLTADAYFIRIDDRIVLTDRFRAFSNPSTNAEMEVNRLFANAGSNAAQFFANAIDTETKGLDIVVTHKARLDRVKLNNTFAMNLNHTQKVGDIHSSDVLREANLVNNYFSESSRIYLEKAVPRVKASLSNELNFKPFSVYLRNTYYGRVTGPGIVDANGDGVKGPFEHQEFGSRIITDLSVGYDLTKNVSMSLGVNNLFDIYPAQNLLSEQNDGQFVYTRSTSQFGINGRYVFARIGFDF